MLSTLKYCVIRKWRHNRVLRVYVTKWRNNYRQTWKYRQSLQWLISQTSWTLDWWRLCLLLSTQYTNEHTSLTNTAVMISVDFLGDLGHRISHLPHFRQWLERFCSLFKESRSRFNILMPCFCTIPSQSIVWTTSHSVVFNLLKLKILQIWTAELQYIVKFVTFMLLALPCQLIAQCTDKHMTQVICPN